MLTFSRNKQATVDKILMLMMVVDVIWRVAALITSVVETLLNKDYNVHMLMIEASLSEPHTSEKSVR